MLVSPSFANHSHPRLPSADHRLKIPTRPSIASRRHSTTVGSLPPSHLSRPIRSSPLAGPSIAASKDGVLISPVSAPPTPGGGTRHLSPLAEFSTTASDAQSVIEGDVSTKKQRRRTLGAVFSKLSFPAAAVYRVPGGSAGAACSVMGATCHADAYSSSATFPESDPIAILIGAARRAS
ncbi:hypothetical protein BN946_scf184876.g10 [Trametes cinnabarina]|uniref:Uncharacterized protein n=1 Tax=Pycnoporus cinnabarinus TaxID=5643 RepID=A0A060SNK3_PYCCI|nr:hypothetical protein BN946_scf184876.g10 [Trametes cinnabarina]